MKNTENFLNKLLMFMKFGTIQLLLLTLSFTCLQANEADSQEVLSKEISIKAINKELIYVLDKIENIADVYFTYSIQKIDAHQMTTINSKKQPLAEVLDELSISLGIKYKVYGENIVLSKDRKKMKTLENTLTGVVLDEKGVPIQFANVLLLEPKDSSIIAGTVTNEFGAFVFQNPPKGSYLLNISFIGFETEYRRITVSPNLDLGNIKLKQAALFIDEIAVKAKRKLIIQKIDRLVLDVANSMMASYGDALDVLAVTPGVNVQNDRITMIGKSTVMVMVDNKMIQMSGQDLSNFLRSIPSEDIENIEVITTPPAKYSAEGNSGIININLKRAKKNSWNALAWGGYTQKKFGTESGGFTFNYNKNKWSIASSFFIRDGLYWQEQDDYAYFPDGIWYTLSPFKNDFRGINGRLDLSYHVNDNWTIGGQYLFNQNKYFVTDAPYTPVFDYETNEIIQFLQAEKSYMDLKPTINSINLNNAFTLDTLGRTLLINLDYFSYTNPDTKEYEGFSVINEPYKKQYYGGINTNNQDVTNLSATVDVELPTDWANIEFGGKVTRSESLNDITFFNSGLVDSKVTEKPLEVNDFTYLEYLEALYISATKKINKEWTSQIGIRMEATQTNSISKNLDFDRKNDYVKFFPTFYLSYAPSKEMTLNFTYNKRITRPNFFELNPNIYFINPFQTIEGNAFLQPSFTDNFEISHSYKNISGKIYYSYEDNVFSQVPLANASNNLIQFTNKNYIDNRRFGFSESFIFEKLGWWTSSNSFDINYSISTFSLEEAHDQLKNINSSFSTSNDFYLNSSKTLSLNISYWHQFPSTEYIFEKKTQSSLSTMIQYAMLNKSLKISLRANDIFKNTADRYSSTVNGVFQESRYYYDVRSVYLSVSYKFGNKNIFAKRHQTGNQEERSRTGN